MNQHGIARLPRAAWRVLRRDGLAAVAAKSWRKLTGGNLPSETPSGPPQPDPAHKERLARLMPYPWFRVAGFTTDGTTLTIDGHAPETMAGRPGPVITLNGRPVLEHVVFSPDPDVARQFWFLGNSVRTSAFRLDIPLAAIPTDDQPHFVLGLAPRSAVQKLNPYKKHYLPKNLGAYQVVPDAARQKRVVSWAHAGTFVHEGYSHWQIYQALAEGVAGRPVDSFESMLDWGCGCGRVTRHMLTGRGPKQRVTGIDIDADNVAFAAGHYSDGTFQAVDLLPPTPFADGSFDLVVATSVMTHLDEPTQFAWLAELRRITRPGAVVILTTHGNTAVAWSNCPLDWIDRWERTGFDATAVLDHLRGHIPSDDYYRNTFHTPKYIREHWSRYFAVKDIVEGVIAHQDAVVMVRG
jgi:SAM-dependent methyltransferase